ncbi:MAG: beta-N-acetylhexosaminidase [Bacteroides sp.]|nr:beta-N-acetylhexosaminidase [Bacteroides sp.]
MFAMANLLTCAQATANYEVVPIPDNIEIKEGKPFVLDGSTTIVCTNDDPQLRKNATMLAGYIKDITGMDLPVSQGNLFTGKPQGKTILLSSELLSDNPEAYQINVTPDIIMIGGASPAGNFYGIQTFRKSIPVEKGKSIEFPQVNISDSPQFGYRGAHFDVARHFFPADSVKTYIDMMALHNMNRLHWHLTDDQGWRLPLKKHPELITKGSVRRGTCIGKDFSSCDSIPYGGFYTSAEIQDVINYAADRYITIIPEIDLPGHMLAALTAHPDLGCTGGPYELWTIWGVADDVLCAGNEGVYNLLDDVLTEVAEIFPSEYIHIGGDECPKDRWKACPKCQAKIVELGFTDDEHSSKEEKLQSHVMSFATDVLARQGKKIIGWDEILEGGLPDNAVVMSWRGAEGGQKAAGMGHDAIMAPYTHYYLDYYQSKDTENEPLSIGGYIPLSKSYSFEPYEGISPENRQHILGVQANLWTEYIHTFDHAQYMVLPRWAALSEVQWSDPKSRDFDAFKQRLSRLQDHYKLNGYNYSNRQE